jgi:uncharacterized protein (TIGR02271 family)
MLTQDVGTLRGMELRGQDDNKIGTIEEIYEDTETRQPEWALVQSGLFGRKRSFVPLRDADVEGDHATVPYDKDQIKNAPGIDPDGELSTEEERGLYEHYGLDWSTGQSDTGPSAGGQAGGEGRSSRTDIETAESSRGTTSSAIETRGLPAEETSPSGREDAMTRSEDELRVGTARRETGRARLRKWVESDTETRTVPVQREQARIEREPITEENVEQAMAGPEITESEHEVPLTEEQPVVEKKTVPKERVRLTKDTQTDEEPISEQVRSERIEAESDRGESPR